VLLLNPLDSSRKLLISCNLSNCAFSPPSGRDHHHNPRHQKISNRLLP
jgi:hypothetical protein